MDTQALIERYRPFFKANLLPIILAFLGLIFLVYGLISLIGSSRGSSSLNFEPARENTASNSAVKNIIVDVEGAVIKPGVYKIPEDARVSDALIAAMGISAEADRNWIEKNLNLAAKLTDGSKIYIPRTGEAAEGIKGATSIKSTNGDQAGVISQQPGLININTANLSELDTLKGIGPATGQKIIDNRPYGSINELVSKKAVGQKVFEGIKEKITVN